MRTYYRGNDALVTDVHFIWGTTPPQTFMIRELQDVGLVRGGSGPLRPKAAYTTGGLLVGVAAAWFVLGGSFGHVGAVLGLAFSAFVVGAYGLSSPRDWELRATYRHAEVLLYASPDSRIFHQVSRALRRSMEDARPASSWYDLAAG